MLSAKEFNLPARTCLEQLDSSTIALVMKRKSRIIMADGRKIQEKASKIREKRPGTRIVLKTTAPVCSKTMLFLQEEGIEILTF